VVKSPEGSPHLPEGSSLGSSSWGWGGRPFPFPAVKLLCVCQVSLRCQFPLERPQAYFQVTFATFHFFMPVLGFSTSC
jgi:hypothetical protein